MRPHERLESRAATWGARVGGVGLVLLAAGVAWTYAGRFHWAAELASSFRWQLGCAGLVVPVLLAITRRLGLALVAVAVELAALGPTLVLWMPAPPPASAVERPTLRVAALNLGWTMADTDAVVAWVAEERPNVLALSEIFWTREDEFDAVLEVLPHVVRWPEAGEVEGEERNERPLGLALYSDRPLDDRLVVDNPNWFRPILAARYPLPGPGGDTPVWITVLHPDRPGNAHRLRRRDSQLDALAGLAVVEPTAVVLGDLNVTGQSRVFGRLLAEGNLRDTRRGHGRLPTFRTERPVAGLWVPIDHVLVGPRWDVLERSVGPNCGSDHRSVLATLRLR